MKRFLVLLVAALLSACTLAPRYQRPDLPVSNQWPADTQGPGETPGPDRATEPTGVGGDASTVISADRIGWRDFFADPRLQRLIEIALENNRSLRIAVLDVAASQAQYRVQRGSLFPAISATGAGDIDRLPSNGALPLGAIGGANVTSYPAAGASGSTFHYYSAGIGFTSYELDLFGRQRSLTTQAFEQYLAQGEARRSTQISLVAEVATDYFAVLADQALVKLTEETLRNETESYDLTKAMYDSDTTTLLSLKQAESAVDAARANLEQYQRQLAQDTHALTLVVGREIPDDLTPETDLESEELLEEVPAGLPSNLIVQRPDIMSAEHNLRAANADIGAARAAFFPSIQLTGSGGTASRTLGGLFSKGSGTWSFMPTITLPIFAGGRNRANLDLAHLEKDIGVAQYELTIQTAFREVSDALSARGTYVKQYAAQQALVAAESQAYKLSEMRFRSGVDSYLATLDAERSLYTAQQQLVTTRQAELANRVTLYKALGGGWEDRMVSRR